MVEMKRGQTELWSGSLMSKIYATTAKTLLRPCRESAEPGRSSGPICSEWEMYRITTTLRSWRRKRSTTRGEQLVNHEMEGDRDEIFMMSGKRRKARVPDGGGASLADCSYRGVERNKLTGRAGGAEIFQGGETAQWGEKTGNKGLRQRYSSRGLPGHSTCVVGMP